MVALHGDIRVNHRKIGEWWAVCQPGKDGIHPYRWVNAHVKRLRTHLKEDQ